MLASLIILLIVSDGFKSLWYIVYPLVSFHSGIPPTNSTICQASGFFIALGTEASGQSANVFSDLQSVTKWLYRFCHLDHRCPYRSLHFQNPSLGRGSWHILPSVLCLRWLDRFSCAHGFSCLRQPNGTIYRNEYILHATCQTVLVSLGIELDSSLHYPWDHHSLVHCDIPPCQAQV